MKQPFGGLFKVDSPDVSSLVSRPFFNPPTQDYGSQDKYLDDSIPGPCLDDLLTVYAESKSKNFIHDFGAPILIASYSRFQWMALLSNRGINCITSTVPNPMAPENEDEIKQSEAAVKALELSLNSQYAEDSLIVLVMNNDRHEMLKHNKQRIERYINEYKHAFSLVEIRRIYALLKQICIYSGLIETQFASGNLQAIFAEIDMKFNLWRNKLEEKREKIMELICKSLIFTDALSGVPILLTRLRRIRLFRVAKIDDLVISKYYGATKKDQYPHLFPSNYNCSEQLISMLFFDRRNHFYFKKRFDSSLPLVRKEFIDLLQYNDQRHWWNDFLCYPLVNTSPYMTVLALIQLMLFSNDFDTFIKGKSLIFYSGHNARDVMCHFLGIRDTLQMQTTASTDKDDKKTAPDTDTEMKRMDATDKEIAAANKNLAEEFKQAGYYRYYAKLVAAEKRIAENVKSSQKSILKNLKPADIVRKYNVSIDTARIIHQIVHGKQSPKYQANIIEITGYYIDNKTGMMELQAIINGANGKKDKKWVKIDNVPPVVVNHYFQTTLAFTGHKYDRFYAKVQSKLAQSGPHSSTKWMLDGVEFVNDDSSGSNQNACFIVHKEAILFSEQQKVQHSLQRGQLVRCSINGSSVLYKLGLLWCIVDHATYKLIELSNGEQVEQPETDAEYVITVPLKKFDAQCAAELDDGADFIKRGINGYLLFEDELHINYLHDIILDDYTVSTNDEVNQLQLLTTKTAVVPNTEPEVRQVINPSSIQQHQYYCIGVTHQSTPNVRSDYKASIRRRLFKQRVDEYAIVRRIQEEMRNAVRNVWFASCAKQGWPSKFRSHPVIVVNNIRLSNDIFIEYVYYTPMPDKIDETDANKVVGRIVNIKKVQFQIESDPDKEWFNCTKIGEEKSYIEVRYYLVESDEDDEKDDEKMVEIEVQEAQHCFNFFNLNPHVLEVRDYLEQYSEKFENCVVNLKSKEKRIHQQVAATTNWRKWLKKHIPIQQQLMRHMNELLKFTYTIIGEEIKPWQPDIGQGFVFVARNIHYVVFKANTETLDPCQQSVVAFDIDKYHETNCCLNKFDTLVLNQYVRWDRVYDTDHLRIPSPIPTMIEGDTLKWTDKSHKLINERSGGVDRVGTYHDESHSVTVSIDGDDDTVYLDFANYEFWDPKKYTPTETEQVGQKKQTINTDAEMKDKDDEKDNNQQQNKDESNKENEGDNNQQARPKVARTTEINDVEHDDVIQDDSNKENEDDVMQDHVIQDDLNKENEDDVIQDDNEDSTQNSFPSDESIDSEFDDDNEDSTQIPFPPNV